MSTVTVTSCFDDILASTISMIVLVWFDLPLVVKSAGVKGGGNVVLIRCDLLATVSATLDVIVLGMVIGEAEVLKTPTTDTETGGGIILAE